MISATEESDDDTDDSVTIRGVGRGKKKDLWTLQRNAKGEMILPSFDKELSLQDKKCIVRSFLTYTYRKFLFLIF
jgi:hypothetical protein